jgi:hypothetical protein
MRVITKTDEGVSTEERTMAVVATVAAWQANPGKPGEFIGLEETR